MKLKKYNQYIREDIQPVIDEQEDLLTPEMDEMDGDLTEEDEETYVGNNMDDDGIDDEEIEEEEGDEYEGTLLLKELAKRLGSEVINNSIDYNGQKINYYSETEAFHVGKMKFETVDEVVDYLTR